jgi:hypothetical protein
MMSFLSLVAASLQSAAAFELDHYSEQATKLDWWPYFEAKPLDWQSGHT